MKLMTGNSNLPLARDIASYLELPLTEALVRRFADEEIFVEIMENVRGEDVFLIQSTSYPVNDNLMELLICIDALVRASARRRAPASTSSCTTEWSTVTCCSAPCSKRVAAADRTRSREGIR